MDKLPFRSIYIKDAIDNKEKLLKIGCTCDLNQRYSSSKSCGNLSDSGNTIPGDFVDELAIHLYFKDYLYTKKGTKEIFYKSDYVMNEFNNLNLNDVYTSLWINRNGIFNVNDIRGDSRKHHVLMRSISIVNPKDADLDIDNSRLDMYLYQIL